MISEKYSSPVDDEAAAEIDVITWTVTASSSDASSASSFASIVNEASERISINLDDSERAVPTPLVNALYLPNEDKEDSAQLNQNTKHLNRDVARIANDFVVSPKKVTATQEVMLFITVS